MSITWKPASPEELARRISKPKQETKPTVKRKPRKKTVE